MGEMSRLSESASECAHFVFFNQYEEAGFDEFVDHVLPAMNAEELRREQGPYSATMRRSRAFSSSSCLRLRSSLTPKSAYFFFQV